MIQRPPRCKPLPDTTPIGSPTVNAGVDQSASEGSTVSLAPATFNDKGTLDTHTATINWGDGTATEADRKTTRPNSSHGPTSDADFTFSSSHVYADNGLFTVTVCV